MACTVFLHVLAHTLIKQLPVLRQVHVYEIHNDNAAHVPEPELPGQFICRTEIDLQCVLFLSVFRLGAVTTVYIHHVHSLCVLDDEICATLVVDSLAKGRLYLLRHIEIVEDGYSAIV